MRKCRLIFAAASNRKTPGSDDAKLLITPNCLHQRPDCQAGSQPPSMDHSNVHFYRAGDVITRTDFNRRHVTNTRIKFSPLSEKVNTNRENVMERKDDPAKT